MGKRLYIGGGCVGGGGAGDVGEGEGGEGGGGGGDDISAVMFRELETSVPRRVSGASSSISPGGDVDWRAAACPCLLVMTAALWLAHVAVMAAFTCFMGRGLALS